LSTTLIIFEKIVTPLENGQKKNPIIINDDGLVCLKEIKNKQ
jgi:hypothetical protein